MRWRRRRKSARPYICLDQLGLGVDALGAAVVVFAGQSGADGVLIEPQTADKRVDVRQVHLLRGADPLLQPAWVVVGGDEELGESRTRQASWLISGQALVVLWSSSCWSGLRVSGRVSSRGRACGVKGRVGRLDAALGDVAVEELLAAGVAAFPDLAQELKDGFSRRAHSRRPTPASSRSWTCCHRARVVVFPPSSLRTREALAQQPL
jgi:hypothetical protein